MKAYTGDKPFIFVSYAHTDRDIVYPIIELLQNNGYHVWYDEGLHIGNDWRDELEERIRCCHAFIFMQSKQSVRSEYCKDEVYLADSEKKQRAFEADDDEDRMPFLTIKLDESNLTGGLRMILDTKQKVSGIDIPANEISQKLIKSKKLDVCREQFRYVEGINWGPSRKEYYFDDAPDHAVLNSVIDNPFYGDERHFLRIDNQSQDDEDHFLTVLPNTVYSVRILYNNDALPESNVRDGGKGIAMKTKISVKLPRKLSANKPEILQANISTDTGEHEVIWDQIALCSTEEVAINYILASAKLYNSGTLSNEGLGAQLFSEGLYIGYNKFNGVIPGGMQYSGEVKFDFTVKPIRKVSFDRTVSVDKKHYSNRVSVLPGDILTFRIIIRNNHYNCIEDVTFRDELPEGIDLIPNTTVLYAVPHLEGRELSDHITSNGINTGLFGEGVTGVIQYRARVREDICSDREMISKSFLYYTPSEYDPDNYYKKTLGETVKMYSEAICYFRG